VKWQENRAVTLAAVPDVRDWRQHLLARLVSDFAQQAANDFVDFHQGALASPHCSCFRALAAVVIASKPLWASSSIHWLLQFFLMVTPGTWRTVLC
jgi:hypothetical protein